MIKEILLRYLRLIVRTRRTYVGVLNKVLYLAAEAFYFFKFYSFAIFCYEEIIKREGALGSRKYFQFYHTLQFKIEKAYFLAGKERHKDELFHCNFERVKEDTKGNQNIGFYWVRWSQSGLFIEGFKYNSKADDVIDVYLDGVKIKSVISKQSRFLPPYFVVKISRGLIKYFPKESVIEVKDVEGNNLTFRGDEKTRIIVPHGDGEFISMYNSGVSISKKGGLIPTAEELSQMQNSFLEIYADVSKVFIEKLNNPLIILYGTLLGYYRGGDFVPGDDDFDVGFISDKTNPKDVKKDTKRIVKELVALGYVISFNRRGKLFRIRRAIDHHGVHLDVRPIWFEDGYCWMHRNAKLNLDKSDFLDPLIGNFKGTEVYYPKNTENFLAAYYGKNWRTPDPTYSNTAQKIPKDVLINLDKTCINYKEYLIMSKEVEGFSGKLYSTGSFSLYPRDIYEKLVEEL